jgi:hypothetical protein
LFLTNLPRRANYSYGYRYLNQPYSALGKLEMSNYVIILLLTKKWRIDMKKLILALTIGMMIGSVTTAVAATQGEVTAVFANFILKINGEEKQMGDTPLVYNGTSYLPVRVMASLVGYDVTYTTESRTINLNSHPAPPTVTTDTYGNQPPIKSDPVDSSIWVSLRELNLNSAYKTTISPGTSQMKIDYLNQSFTFNLPNNADAEKITTSKPGNITMLIKDGATYLKRSDLKRLGLPH